MNQKKNRYIGIGWAIVLVQFCIMAGWPAAAEPSLPQRPNILLITADDLGHDDLSFHGNTQVTTPRLDQLAQQSTRFTDFNVAPLCAPTRASLLTGRHYYKTGVSGVHGGRDFMNLSETTIADILGEQGYVTGTWGKWHLGKTRGYFPWHRGFQEAYYAKLYHHKNNGGIYMGEPVKHDKWASEVVADYTIDFIKRHRDKPFLAYASFLAPHSPWLASDDFKQPYLDKGFRPAVANLYGMISEMDYHIGRILDYLSASGLDENTVVIFLSDNGPIGNSENFGRLTEQEWRDRNPNAYNGNKAQIWQNAIKSPLFIRWKGKFENAEIARYTNVMDILPTVLALTNTRLPEDSKALDGVSFANYLEGRDLTAPNPRVDYIGTHGVKSDKPFFNSYTPIDAEAREGMRFDNQQIALRTEHYKLLKNPPRRDNYPKAEDSYVLVDMQADPKESANILSKVPDVAAPMVEGLEAEFSRLRTSRSAYAAPIFLIGGGNEPAYVVKTFAASSTGGNTEQSGHYVKRFGEEGDFATYRIWVEKPGRYLVYTKQKKPGAKGVTLTLSTETSSASKTLNRYSVQRLDWLDLTAGGHVLRLEVTKNPTNNPVEQLESLIFVEQSKVKQVKPSQLDL